MSPARSDGNARLMEAVFRKPAPEAMEETQVLIVGGGVVGCAIAREVSAIYGDVFLLEQFAKLGTQTSSRNSGVIHSGVFSRPGSRKAAHCVEGNRLTYEFCREQEIPHRQTGKLIVAQCPEEEVALAELCKQGQQNGVEGLEIVSREFIQAKEPYLQANSALWVPSAGIVDSERLVRGYARAAEQRGAHVLTNARLLAAEPDGGQIRVHTSRGPLAARVFINSAGLFADEVARMLGLPEARIYPCRGEYFEIRKARSHWVQGLVYPVPDRSGHVLGVHLTKTLSGNVLVGPNAKYVREKTDYETDREPAETFYQLARRMLPDLALEDLTPSYSGLRPKLTPPERPEPADFRIERDPLYPAAIHLLGIESPGLTAAPSIARAVAQMVRETLG